MQPTVLFVHSSGPQGPGEGSEPFAARLRDELGPAYEVVFPLMPSPDDPHYEPWSERLSEVLSELDEPPIVVAHSLGASVFLKHLAETGPNESVMGLVLVATPFWGESGWEAEWALPRDWPDGSTELPSTLLFHSRDDEEIPSDHLDLYAKRLPGVEARLLDGNGHLFDRGDLSPIGEAVRGLTRP